LSQIFESEEKKSLFCLPMNIVMKPSIKEKILFAVLFWASLLILVFIVILKLRGLEQAFQLSLIYFLPLIIPVLLHEFVFEKFFLKKKFLFYGIFTSVIIVVLGYFIDLLEKAAYPKGDSSTIGSIIVFILLYMGAKYLVMGAKQQFRLKELEAKQAQAELDLLKSQVNPHFLLNSLNSIYSLILNHSTKSSDAVLLLSDLMRYILETSKKKFVPLKEEISFIENYIELEKLRLGSNFTINYSTSGESANLYIAPMMLITFVENIFKHGVSQVEANNLFEIRINVIDNVLHFSCLNNIALKNNALEKKDNPTGIENVRRRLELLYHDDHDLTIEKNSGKFLVDLKIKLNC